ncbi:MAG: TonB-dependent receptor [Woeseiaceae bacterium]
MSNTQQHMEFGRTKVAQAVSAVLIASAVGQPALAQELEEIIVTATKRAESSMDVPIAVQALSGDFLREVNLDDVKDLVAFTPGVTGNSKDSFLDTIRVRGIVTNDFGNGGDPSIGVYKNGFYQGRNGAAVTSLYDVERAEILRGPQGFLFGRNAISGAMNIFTKKPSGDDRDAYVDVRAGERGILRAEGGTNFSMSENFAVRLAGLYSTEDGYVTNEANGNKYIGHDKTALRLTGVYDNDGPLDATVYLEYEDRDQSGTIYRATGGAGSYALLESIYGDLGLPSDPRNVNIDEPDNGIIDNGEVATIGLEINYELEGMTFTSLTGYKDHDYHYTEDFDATSLTIFNYEQIQSGKYFEQEFRLTSDNDGMFSWYAGASYYSEDIDSEFLGQQDEDLYCNVYWGDTCQGVFDFYNSYYGGAYAYVLYDYFGTYTWEASPTGRMDDWNRTKGDFSGWAAYVDLSFRFNDQWDASLGVRYNDDTKDMSQEVLTDRNPSPVLGNRVQTGFTTPDGPISDSLSWDKTTYRAVLNYRMNDDNLLYGTVTTGYKQGGYNSFKAIPDGPWGLVEARPGTHVPGSFDGEDVISYELGYKGTALEGRSQLQLNVFSYEYTDLQATCTVPGNPGVVVCNVGTVDAVGLEGVWNFAINEYLTLGTGIAYFDSEATGIQAFCSEGERVLGDENACEGEPLPGAPEWTAYATLSTNFPAPGGAWFGNLSWNWEDETRTGFLPLSPATTEFPEGARMVNEYNEVQLLAGYESDKGWSLAAYVENLTDEEYYDAGGSGGNPANPYVQSDISPSRPRTAGVRFIYKF